MKKAEAENYCNNLGMSLVSKISEPTRLEFRFFGVGTFWTSNMNESRCTVNNYRNQNMEKTVDSCDMRLDVVCEKIA